MSVIPEPVALELRVQALEDKVGEAGRLALFHADKAKDRLAVGGPKSAVDVAHDLQRTLADVGRALLFDPETRDLEASS